MTYECACECIEGLSEKSLEILWLAARGAASDGFFPSSIGPELEERDLFEKHECGYRITSKGVKVVLTLGDYESWNMRRLGLKGSYRR